MKSIIANNNPTEREIYESLTASKTYKSDLRFHLRLGRPTLNQLNHSTDQWPSTQVIHINMPFDLTFWPFQITTSTNNLAASSYANYDSFNLRYFPLKLLFQTPLPLIMTVAVPPPVRRPISARCTSPQKVPAPGRGANGIWTSQVAHCGRCSAGAARAAGRACGRAGQAQVDGFSRAAAGVLPRAYSSGLVQLLCQ